MPYPKNYKRFLICFNPNDWEIVKANADKANMNISKYITAVTVNGDIKKYDMKAVAKLYRELNSIGNNINQIVRVANKSNSVYEADFKAIKDSFNMVKMYTEQRINALFEDDDKE